MENNKNTDVILQISIIKRIGLTYAEYAELVEWLNAPVKHFMPPDAYTKIYKALADAVEKDVDIKLIDANEGE